MVMMATYAQVHIYMYIEYSENFSNGTNVPHVGIAKLHCFCKCLKV